MPFGAFYGALFLVVWSFWLTFVSAESSWAALHAFRLFLALLSLTLALGLMLRRTWARWSALLLVLAVALLDLELMTFRAGVIEYVFLFGSLAAAVLLLIPATGDLRRGAPPMRKTASGFGKLLGLTACLALVGLCATLPWSGSRADAERLAARPASQLASALGRKVRWLDFGTGLERASAGDKPMLVTFETDWCGYCKKMGSTTWRSQAVVERLSEIVAVRVVADEEQERNGFRGVELAERYGVSGYPAIFLLDHRGDVLSRTGGYLGPRQFLDWLDDSLQETAIRRPAGMLRTSGS